MDTVYTSVKNIYPYKYVAFFIACHHNRRQRLGMFSFQILMKTWFENVRDKDYGMGHIVQSVLRWDNVNIIWGGRTAGASWLASEMLFRQKELLRWLGVSVFEIWVWLLSLTIFSVLLVLKVSSLVVKLLYWILIAKILEYFFHVNSLKLTTFQVEEQLLPSETSWFLVFSPLFICDGLNAYFCIIVFIRQYLDRLKMRREGQRPPNKFPPFQSVCGHYPEGDCEESVGFGFYHLPKWYGLLNQ